MNTILNNSKHLASGSDETSGRRRRGRPPNDAQPGVQNRRDHILDAATKRFAEFGFRATTVRQIADDVGLGSGSLFHHFETKEEMLGEIVRATVLRLRDEAHRISTAQLAAEQRLVDLIHVNLQEVTANQHIHAILDLERKLLRQRDNFADIVDARAEAYRAWELIIDDGIGEGRFLAAIDRFLTISTIVRMLSTAADWSQGTSGSTQSPRKAYDIASLSDFYCGLILRSLRQPDLANAEIPKPTA